MFSSMGMFLDLVVDFERLLNLWLVFIEVELFSAPLLLRTRQGDCGVGVRGWRRVRGYSIFSRYSMSGLKN